MSPRGGNGPMGNPAPVVLLAHAAVQDAKAQAAEDEGKDRYVNVRLTARTYAALYRLAGARMVESGEPIAVSTIVREWIEARLVGPDGRRQVVECPDCADRMARTG